MVSLKLKTNFSVPTLTIDIVLIGILSTGQNTGGTKLDFVVVAFLS